MTVRKQTLIKVDPLKGEYLGFKECRLKPDLLLIYLLDKEVLRLVDIGSHSELFD